MEVYNTHSWFSRRDGVVVVSDDVQNVVRGIREISDRLHVFYNEQSGDFDIVESCLDGADRLVFSVSELDHRVIHRLHGADHWFGNEEPEYVLADDEDFIAQSDEQEAQAKAELDEQARDKVRDAGLRLAWALDAVKDHHSVGGSIRVPKDVDG